MLVIAGSGVVSEASAVIDAIPKPTRSGLEATRRPLSSGVASLLWTLLAPGDEIIADKTLYGCTFGFLNHGLAKFGVKVTHVDLTVPANLDAAINPARTWRGRQSSS